MEKVEKITFHVISHTHWDREWYLPFEVFRLELVELIDNLLNILDHNKNFIFHLDGQSIILQDYLEISPDKKELIKKYVSSGNIIIGPWYVLSDEFLTSGEALIRNLLYGIRDSLEFGNVMMIGYLPDQFGQIAQLPQIFKGFNIHSAIIGRGIQDGFSEHNWHGLNGDKILAISLTHWYNNAQKFPNEPQELHRYLDKIYETHARTTHSGHILLMNGCDHLFPQSNLLDTLKLASSNKRWQIKQCSLNEAIKNIEQNEHNGNYPVYFGELRDDNNKYVLAGTLSSRVYLKLLNYRCQTKLEKIIEPFATLLSVRNYFDYPFQKIHYAWKLLIQNHAHDSICGCSIDEVHKEMETRFLKVEQVLDKLQENLLEALTHLRHEIASPSARNDIHNPYLQLINLTNYCRNECVEAELEFPLGPPAEHPSALPTINIEEIKDFSLTHNGKNIDFEILNNYKTHKMTRSKNEVPLLQPIQKIRVLFNADLEPFSIISYEIDTNHRNQKLKVKDEPPTLEFKNKNYKLKINNDGTLTIILNASNHKFENIHFISIEDDLGDEYSFEPNKGSKIICSRDWVWNIKVTEENKLRKKFLLETTSFELKIEIEVICHVNSDRIDFKTKIDNNLKNKRIRINFPTNLQTSYIAADTPFGVLKRARPPINWTNYALSQPLHNWIDHNNNKNSGLTFFGGGLADYELYENGNGFSVTLIRAVGRLSKVKSHSLVQTPDAQCNRTIEFNYAIYPHNENINNSEITKEELLFQIPILINQSSENLNINSLIKLSEELTLSSLKRSENNNELYILRLYNPNTVNVSGGYLSLNFDFKRLYLLNLNEEKKEDITKHYNDQIKFNVKPFEIITFGIEI